MGIDAIVAWTSSYHLSAFPAFNLFLYIHLERKKTLKFMHFIGTHWSQRDMFAVFTWEWLLFGIYSELKMHWVKLICVVAFSNCGISRQDAFGPVCSACFGFNIL